MLTVEGAVKAFGSHYAIRDVSFRVGAGEFFTLLGPSGCGKTTTLMALAGLHDLDAGRVLLADRDITHEPPERRGMGLVFQSYALFPHMTVLDNVLFPLQMRGVPDRDARGKARESLRLVALNSRHEALQPAQLSGGQQQRVALARALAFDPAVLLMDEPLAALDRQLRQGLQFELRHLQARLRTTVVYVTHDQEEALVLSDRIAVMRDGRVEQLGSPRDVYDRPANAFVAGFVGSSNRVEVEVSRDEPDVWRAKGDTLPEEFVVEQPWTGDTRALLVVRPERVSILKHGGDTRHPNRVAGKVTDVAFLGDHVRVELQSADGTQWTARLAAGQPSDAIDGMRPGDEVQAAWAAKDCRIVAL